MSIETDEDDLISEGRLFHRNTILLKYEFRKREVLHRFGHVLLHAVIVTIFEPEKLTVFARKTNIYIIYKLSKAIFSTLNDISQLNFAILLISLCSFELW